MSEPYFLCIYSNGHIWHQQRADFTTPSSEAGTLLGVYRMNSDASAQQITTLTGSGNASASALALPASGALKPTGRYGLSGLGTDRT